MLNPDPSVRLVHTQSTIQGGNFGFHNTYITPFPSCLLLYHYPTELQLVISLLHEIFPYTFLSALGLL